MIRCERGRSPSLEDGSRALQAKDRAAGPRRNRDRAPFLFRLDNAADYCDAIRNYARGRLKGEGSLLRTREAVAPSVFSSFCYFRSFPFLLNKRSISSE